MNQKNNLEEPFKFMRGDYCFVCRKERAIEIYDVNDNPLNYTLFLDKYDNNIDNIDKVFNSKVLSYMKCRQCNTLYMIDFSKRTVIPLLDMRYKLNSFLNDLKE